MVATIDLTSASSNMKAYLQSWDSGFTSNYGKFWDSADGLVTNPDSADTYEQWGVGSSGGKGLVIDGSMQYSQGNLTGDAETITLGTGYSESDASGISVSSELVITSDSSFASSSQDAFDFAIYGLSVQGSTSYLYSFLASEGTIINDTTGSDILVGFGGADTFVFTGGGDTVTSGSTGTYGYQDGTDTLDVSAWGVTSFSSLTLLQAGTSAIAKYGSDYVRLENTSTTDLDASDFIFA